MNKSITLCITVFNEEENLENLFIDIKDVLIHFPTLDVVLVDNASEDSSNSLLRSFVAKNPSNVTLASVENNLGYGGGLAHAARLSNTEYVCFYPADRQYLAQDLILVIEKFRELKASKSENFIIKGNRVNREDSFQAKLVSRVYTWLCRVILGLKSQDTNGLPKIAPKAYLDRLGNSLSSSFFFDAQILAIAMKSQHDVFEVEVSFRSRERGSSSWASKRIQTYFRTIDEMLAFRKTLRSVK